MTLSEWRLRGYALIALVAVALALCAAVAARAGDDQPPRARDTWFTLSLGGHRCGWLHESVSVVDGGVETFNEMRMSVGRAGSETSMAIAWKCLERPIGHPLHCEVKTEAGGLLTEARFEFKGTEIAVTERAGGRSVERTMANPSGSWLTPAQVEALIDAQRASGASEFHYRTIDPGSGMQIVEVKSTRSGESGEGRTTWSTENATLGITSTELVSREGELLSSRTRLPLGDLLAERADRASAQRPWKGADIDLIRSTMVPLAAPEDRLLKGTTATLAVTALDGAAIMFPTAGAQTSRPRPEGGSEVTVTVGGTTPATPEEVQDPRYLASTAIVDAGDPAVQALASRALLDATLTDDSPAASRAEGMRAFVDRFIDKKNLASAFASASSVATTRSGDCSEHAVLLAALLRSQGIPARLASGLVYADEFAGKRGVFAWHMWTQALIDGRWLDFDATLRGRAFHAGHLLIATSPQDDASIDADFSRLLAVIGNLRIEVIRVD